MKEDKKLEVSRDSSKLMSEIESLKREQALLKQTVADQALDIATLMGWKNHIQTSLRKQMNKEKDKSKKKDSVS